MCIRDSFKALLFLGAGAVIHALGGEQDMRRMGGLRRKIPWTFATMTAATLAIAGTPFFSGFFSKDQILWKAWSSPYGSWIYWLLAAVTAMLTSFYMFRLWFLTFFGERRVKEDHAATHQVHESPWIMLGPLVVLAVLSVIGGYVGVPDALGGNNRFDRFLAPVFPEVAAAEAAEGNTELLLTAASVAAAALGFFFAWLLYCRRRDLPGRITTQLGGLYRAVANKYYVDEAYRAIFVEPLVEGSSRLLWRGMDTGVIDGAVNHAATGSRNLSDALRRMQSGNIRSYAGWVAAGAVLVIAYLIWMGTQ